MIAPWQKSPVWLQTPSVSPGVQDIANGNPGPYENADKLFWIYDEVVTGAPDTFQLVAYRSDDHGQTQPMNRIASGGRTNENLHTAVGVPNGTIIPISYARVIAGSLHIFSSTFDMAGNAGLGAFGPEVDTGVSFPIGDNSGTTISVIRANGDLVEFYDDNGSVFAVVYHGGFGMPIAIGTGTHPFPLIGANAISGGNVGVFWSDGTHIQYSVLSQPGAVTTTQVTTQTDIITNDPAKTQQLPFATIYDSVSDTISWIFLKNLHPDMGVYLASMSPSSSPSAIINLIYRDVGDVVEFLNPTLAGSDDGSTFATLLWSVTKDRQLQILQGNSLTAGPWTGPTLFYDGAVNAPNPPPTNLHNVFPSFSRFLHDGSFVNTSNFLPPAGTTSDAVDMPAAMVPPAAPSPGVIIRRKTIPIPLVLPDPRLRCHNSAQKRCVFPDGRRVQVTKGVHGYYAV